MLIDEVQRGGDPLILAIKADVDRHGFSNGRVDDSDFRHLRWFRDTLGERFINGVVVHLGDQTLPAGDRLTSMPVSALWKGQ